VRVAIVHPWFLAMGGAEQVVGVLAEMYPDADILTLFCEKSGLPPQLANRRIITSKWNLLPQKYLYYRQLMPFFPSLFEAMDLRGYDLVITSDSCIIKGVLPDEHATHVCYCHSPMRCLYDQYWDYVESMPPIVRWYFKRVARRLRTWDFVAAHRITGIATNARYVANRVQTYYGLPSCVIVPPVRTESAYVDDQTEDYYLSVGRLVDAKRIDVLIEACNRLSRRLVIVGSGRAEDALKKLAGPTIEFAGRVSDQDLAVLYARCKALLFAAKEDFGMTPLEAQAYGRPVIAFGEGGIRETVLPYVTGLFFKEQNSDSLAEAILEFEDDRSRFDPAVIREHACTFDAQNFKRKFKEFVDHCVKAKQAQKPWTELPKEIESQEGSPVNGYWDSSESRSDQHRQQLFESSEGTSIVQVLPHTDGRTTIHE
jgi:glycosyltransferase involved in cell wall biosynthesis